MSLEKSGVNTTAKTQGNNVESAESENEAKGLEDFEDPDNNNLNQSQRSSLDVAAAESANETAQHSYEFENAVLVFKQPEPASQDVSKDIPMVTLSITDKNHEQHISNNSQLEQTDSTTQHQLNDDANNSEIDDYFRNYKRSVTQSDQESCRTRGKEQRTVLDGLFGCMKPIMNLWSSNKPTMSNSDQCTDDYDVPFDALTDMVWLGSGAQGCVFKGLLYGQEVAIKKVKSKEEANIRNLRKLNHPNLVKFKGASFNGDKFFCIIMEFCRYGQLYSFLNNAKERAVLRPARMMDWAKQIASGMSYLHGNKIIHRDLKSPNILIGDNNYIKISDFGASKNITGEMKSTLMSFKVSLL